MITEHGFKCCCRGFEKKSAGSAQKDKKKMKSAAMSGRSTLKIQCPACNRKLDLSDLEAFTKVECPLCGEEIVVPAYFSDLLLEEPIGQGPITDVYRALDLTLDREVAAKIVKQQADTGTETIATFLRETKAAAALNHPHVIPIYSCGEADDRFFVIMQLMEGLSIEQKVASEGPLPLNVAFQVAVEVVKGLKAALEKGVLHRNLKPSNILTDSEGNIKISDFGHCAAGFSTAIDAETALALFYYQSPQQIQQQEYRVSDDVYSLGACLYFMVTGQVPFQGVSSSDIVEAKEENSGLSSPKELRDDLPAEVSDYIMKLFSPAAQDRPQDYGEISNFFARQRKALRKSVGAKHRLQAQRGGQQGTGAGDITRRHHALRPLPAKEGRPRSATVFINLLLIASIIVLATLVVLLWRKQYAGSEQLMNDVNIQQPGNGHVAVPELEDSPVQAETVADDEGIVDNGPEIASPVRPRPKDLNFQKIEKQLREYLQQLPEPRRNLERQRLKFLKTSRDYLIKLMQFAPYRGGEEIYLRNGNILKGSIPYCAEDGVAFRPAGPDSRLRTLKWDELSFDQYVLFYDYYIRLRKGSLPPAEQTPEIRQAVADDSFRLALLCDWFGQGALAEKYINLILNLQPTYDLSLLQIYQRETGS